MCPQKKQTNPLLESILQRPPAPVTQDITCKEAESQGVKSKDSEGWGRERGRERKREVGGGRERKRGKGVGEGRERRGGKRRGGKGKRSLGWVRASLAYDP